jgi:hypothetical protein
MRRACALARDYASRRIAFGRPLSAHPLHRATLADLDLEWRAGFLLVFELAALLGADEMGEASTQERALLRLLTPVAKLYTAKQAVAVCSEALECFGGAGYIEDTGLPRLLRDAQVLPIWEGTTNVLSLDVLRVLGSRDRDAFAAFSADVERRLRTRPLPVGLAPAHETLRRALERLRAYVARMHEIPPADVEAGARRLSFALARCFAAALLLELASARAGAADAADHVAAAERWCGSELAPLAELPAADAAPSPAGSGRAHGC